VVIDLSKMNATCPLYLSLFLTQLLPWARASSFTRFLDHTQRSTVGRTPLDERSARSSDLGLTHNTHNRQAFLPLVGLEPTISAGERPQTYALDRVATGTGIYFPLDVIFTPEVESVDEKQRR